MAPWELVVVQHDRARGRDNRPDIRRGVACAKDVSDDDDDEDDEEDDEEEIDADDEEGAGELLS